MTRVVGEFLRYADAPGVLLVLLGSGLSLGAAWAKGRGFRRDRLAMSLGVLGLSAGLAGVLLLTLSAAEPSMFRPASSLDLVPGEFMADLVAGVNVERAQVLANVAMSVPLAMALWVLAPARFGRLSAIAGPALLQAALELLQYVLHTYRVSSLDDVLLAVIGSCIGLGIGLGVADVSRRRSARPISST